MNKIIKVQTKRSKTMLGDFGMTEGVCHSNNIDLPPKTRQTGPLTTAMFEMKSCKNPCSFFHPALPRRLTQHVWSAWVNINITSSNAMRHSPGTSSIQLSPNELRVEICFSSEEISPFVSAGSGPKVADQPNTTANISAHVAALQLIEHTNTLEHRKYRALTHYHLEAWEHYLNAKNIMYTHGHIIQGLQISFKLDFSLITITQTLPNWDSIIIHSKPSSDVIHNKLCSGWYLGLFTKDELEHLISPLPSSPFSIIPKATIGKYHIQQNHSFPHKPNTMFPNPSINSYINSNNFLTTWGTFSIFSLMLSHLLLHTQLATRDVSEAYHGILHWGFGAKLCYTIHHPACQSHSPSWLLRVMPKTNRCK